MKKGLKKGFTLVELLVVIAIIAILATVVIINVGSARQKANNTSTLNNMSTAQKVAAGCLAEEGYLTGASGVLTTTAGNAICASTTSPGNWPTINLRSSNGRAWGIVASAGPTDAATSATALSILANTGVVGTAGNFQINCTITGCTKQQSNATDWTATLTW